MTGTREKTFLPADPERALSGVGVGARVLWGKWIASQTAFKSYKITLEPGQSREEVSKAGSVQAKFHEAVYWVWVCGSVPVAAGVRTVVVCNPATNKPLWIAKTTPEHFPLPLSAPKESPALLTIQRKLNSPRNSSEDRTWYFIVFLK